MERIRDVNNGATLATDTPSLHKWIANYARAWRARVVGFETTKASYQIHRSVGWVPAHVVPPRRLTIEGWLDRTRSFRRSEIDGSLRTRVIPQLDAALNLDPE